MIVINLFGSPGAGKSTTAAGLFFLMKSKGINCELVTEFAKDLVWQERYKTLDDQLYIFAKQNHKLFQLRNKINFAITDSPLLFSDVYNRSYHNFSFNKFVHEIFESYNNINFFLKRVKDYTQTGRIQNECEAKDIDLIIYNVLLPYKYEVIDSDEKAPEKIFNKISDRI